VAEILKTLPTFFARGKIRKFLRAEFSRFYFTLGRGKPQQAVTRLWFTHKGIIIGYFDVAEIVQNAGQLPKLTTLDGRPSAWQIKPDRWVAVCRPPFHHLRDFICHEGFRGWRYFDLAAHRGTMDAKIRL
jgi:hypothetical protein